MDKYLREVGEQSRLIGIKKGATLCSNLVNLKSNTMKNTVAKVGFLAKHPN